MIPIRTSSLVHAAVPSRRAGIACVVAPPALAAILATLLGGCAAPGPDYVRPAPAGQITAAFKESGPWKPAAPGRIDPDGRWWTAYGDPELDRLVEQAGQASQGIAQAAAQLRQAQALVRSDRAAYFPSVGASLGDGRARSLSATGVPIVQTTHSIGLQAAWEPDLWGRVRRQVEAGRANADAAAADLAAARLTIQAEVVNDYLQLRVTDQQKALYARILTGYQKSLQLTQSQFHAGVVTRSDVSLAQATLKSAQALAIDLDATRAQLEHAIAILLGRTPAEFSIAPAPMVARLPDIPAGLPSELLQRRPDIAAAERLTAAANAGIGVAMSAYYPSLTLSASGGYSGLGLGPLIDVPGKVWALGSALAGTLFDGGLRRAQTDAAVAAFDAQAAAYRQTVLTGFQEVEDNLAILRVLAQERSAQDDAVKASIDSERVLLSQYRAGTTNYLSVITAQQLSLGNQRTALQLVGRQYAASVSLIKALGGGWSVAQLAAADTVKSDAGPAGAGPAKE